MVHRKLPGFEGRSKISTWLVGICYCIASDRQRLAYVRREIGGGQVVDNHVDPHPGPEEVAEQRERMALLDELLAELRPEQREVFVMHELSELEGKEIATIVGAPIKTVFSRLRLGRAAFAAALARRRQQAENYSMRSPAITTALAGGGHKP